MPIKNTEKALNKAVEATEAEAEVASDALGGGERDDLPAMTSASKEPSGGIIANIQDIMKNSKNEIKNILSGGAKSLPDDTKKSYNSSADMVDSMNTSGSNVKN